MKRKEMLGEDNLDWYGFEESWFLAATTVKLFYQTCLLSTTLSLNER
jgi:hypothetical protein